MGHREWRLIASDHELSFALTCFSSQEMPYPVIEVEKGKKIMMSAFASAKCTKKLLRRPLRYDNIIDINVNKYSREY